MTEDYNNIREWLLPKLRKAGLSIEQLARMTNVSRAAIYFYLNDDTRPTEQTMIAICRVLGVPPEEGLSQYTPRRRGRKRVKKPKGRFGKPPESKYNSHLYD